jgi:hypothetical protein
MSVFIDLLFKEYLKAKLAEMKALPTKANWQVTACGML